MFYMRVIMTHFAFDFHFPSLFTPRRDITPPTSHEIDNSVDYPTDIFEAKSLQKVYTLKKSVVFFTGPNDHFALH